MRRFSSYGPPNPKSHYFAPREELIDRVFRSLTGEGSMGNDYCLTVWAPRQTGKSWLMQQVLFRVRQSGNFLAIKVNLEDQKDKNSVPEILQGIARKIGEELGLEFEGIDNQETFQEIFKRGVLTKPLVLLLDEFDALPEEAINSIVSTFRNIYMNRLDQMDVPYDEKRYLLHAVALIGVRSVLGVENVKGSPFNIQQSFHIPNLTFDEVEGMFRWYERESGQAVESGVVRRLYDEVKGQPGLVGWFGELLTDTYNQDTAAPITMDDFDEVYAAATYTLPNNNILNIISKVSAPPYRQWVLELFKTGVRIPFRYDDKETGFLYMNGVVGLEKAGRTEYFIRFSSPFVQKRLFNFFANELFGYLGQLVEPFEKLDNVVGETELNIPGIIGYYGRYLSRNRHWLLKDVPRRKDLRIYEAIFHFNLYKYLAEFLGPRGGKVVPEFPTGNGKVDLVVRYQERMYALELKSFAQESAYKDSLTQAAEYARQLKLGEIFLVFFVEAVDEDTRRKYEIPYCHESSGVTVTPLFVVTGE